MNPTKIILASNSKSRQLLLKNAGIDIDILPANIDEDAIKLKQSLSGEKLALKLAIEKALKISSENQGSFIIGCDQTMECDGLLFDKPKSIIDGKKQLKFLAGKTHTLNSAITIIKNNEVLWSNVSKAKLTMVKFTNEFIDDYINKIGDDVCSTVGGYKLEGIGVQLFSKIEGDYWTILGLPLLPLLQFLRKNDIIKI